MKIQECIEQEARMFLLLKISALDEQRLESAWLQSAEKPTPGMLNKQLDLREIKFFHKMHNSAAEGSAFSTRGLSKG
jgi:hypothetical protein